MCRHDYSISENSSFLQNDYLHKIPYTPGKIICNCIDVSDNEIIETIQLGADLPTLQSKLKCGTECGSCVPELRRLVQTHCKHAA